MFDIIYPVVAILSFPIWFIGISLFFRYIDGDNYKKAPIGIAMWLSLVLAFLFSILWFITIPIISIILVARRLVKPYENAVEFLYKVLFEKE
jgi:hypothetical protein